MTGPQDWITTAGLMAATAASAAACGGAIKRLCCAGGWDTALQRSGTLIATLLCAAVFLYRAFAVHQSWLPLQSHVDGLSLMAALLGATITYLHLTQRLPGVGLFALPVLVMLTLWGVCASWWTLRPFSIESVWATAHLMSVYLGSLAFAAAAAAGALWLYIDRQMRSKDHRAQRLQTLGRLGDLESIEAAIHFAATFGFVLLTIGLITGVIILTGAAEISRDWWRSPKVVLAAAVWLIFALVMHVRFVPTFRGRRAALLSILGFILIVMAMAVAQTLPGPTTEKSPKPKIEIPKSNQNTRHFARRREEREGAKENKDKDGIRFSETLRSLPSFAPLRSSRLRDIPAPFGEIG